MMHEYDAGAENEREACKERIEEIMLILRKIEWGVFLRSYCPECVSIPEDGHKEDCRFGALLALEKPWVY